MKAEQVESSKPHGKGMKHGYWLIYIETFEIQWKIDLIC